MSFGGIVKTTLLTLSINYLYQAIGEQYVMISKDKKITHK